MRAQPARDEVEGLGRGYASRDPVTHHRGGPIGRDRSPCLEAERVAVGAFGDHADDLGLEPERIAHAHQPADAGAQPDRHIDRVEIGCCGEELQRVGADAAHEALVEGGDHDQVPLGRERLGMLVRGLEVRAVHHQLAAEGAHRRVLAGRIALGHHQRRGEAEAGRGVGDALAVVAPGGGDHAGGLAVPSQIVHVDEAAPHLEGADRGVVLVLDPNLGPGALRQQRPGDLRRGVEGLVNERGGLLEFGQRGQAHGDAPLGRWRRTIAGADNPPANPALDELFSCARLNGARARARRRPWPR